MTQKLLTYQDYPKVFTIDEVTILAKNGDWPDLNVIQSEAEALPINTIRAGTDTFSFST